MSDNTRVNNNKRNCASCRNRNNNEKSTSTTKATTTSKAEVEWASKLMTITGSAKYPIAVSHMRKEFTSG